jgi:hypothetical protein
MSISFCWQRDGNDNVNMLGRVVSKFDGPCNACFTLLMFILADSVCTVAKIIIITHTAPHAHKLSFVILVKMLSISSN